MSHDKTSGPNPRKGDLSHDKRRTYYAESKRQKFDAADHIRKDWNYALTAEFLENRARGYNGLLRQILCTAAHMLKEAAPVMRDHERTVALAVPAVSKRSQQPGRLSGSERKALKKFVVSVTEVPMHGGEGRWDEVMAEGRALLANVRKRALGAQTEEEDKS